MQHFVFSVDGLLPTVGSTLIILITMRNGIYIHPKSTKPCFFNVHSCFAAQSQATRTISTINIQAVIFSTYNRLHDYKLAAYVRTSTSTFGCFSLGRFTPTSSYISMPGRHLNPTLESKLQQQRRT